MPQINRQYSCKGTKGIDKCLKDITFFVNYCLEKGVFPNKLKSAGASPVFKKAESRSEKLVGLLVSHLTC